MKEIQPLEGIKIVDFTRLLPGPLGTHLLSQLGAEVIKIESPKRMDYTRFYEPKIGDTSAMFHTMNHTKKQLMIDYESQEGYQEIVNIIKDVDVLVEQFRPGAMKEFKLSFDEVKKINPNIVYISVTGYGQTGTYNAKAGHDLNYMATSGLLDLNRDEKGKPIIPGFQIADIAGGSYMLVSACTSGLLAQRIQQKAQYIDVSLLDATVPLGAIAQGMHQGKASYKQTPILSGMLVNYNVYECKDQKWIALGALELKFWNSFCEMVAQPTWKATKDTQLIDGVFDKEKLISLFKSKTQAEWTTLSKEYDVCLSPILTIEEVSKDEHIRDRVVFLSETIEGQKVEVFNKIFKTYTSS